MFLHVDKVLGVKKSSMLNYTEATFPHFQNQNIQREKRTQGQTAPINPLMMAKDAASVDSMALARPECAGLLSRSGYVRSGLHGWPSPRHKDPLHILLYPGHCGDPAPSRHTTPLAAPQLNASPVTGVGGSASSAAGSPQVLQQVSPSRCPKGSGDFGCFASSSRSGCRCCLAVTRVNVAFRGLPNITTTVSAFVFVGVNESFLQ